MTPRAVRATGGQERDGRGHNMILTPTEVTACGPDIAIAGDVTVADRSLLCRLVMTSSWGLPP